jgi:mannose-6-phosphate isomerase-like protein (cupin superfamily)
VEIFEAAGRWFTPDNTGASYEEHLSVPDLSLGTYCLAAGATDTQTPHDEDEVYVVTSGRAKFTGGDRTVDVSAGSTFFVPAREEHRFHDITEDLTVLVFFGPAEGTRSS